jgi:hypothetical protein
MICKYFVDIQFKVKIVNKLYYNVEYTPTFTQKPSALLPLCFRYISIMLDTVQFEACKMETFFYLHLCFSNYKTIRIINWVALHSQAHSKHSWNSMIFRLKSSFLTSARYTITFLNYTIFTTVVHIRNIAFIYRRITNRAQITEK